MVGVKVNAEKTKQAYIFLSRHQTVQHNHRTNAANKATENVAKLRYLQTT
jgi:hypothetical protein